MIYFNATDAVVWGTSGPKPSPTLPPITRVSRSPPHAIGVNIKSFAAIAATCSYTRRAGSGNRGG